MAADTAAYESPLSLTAIASNGAWSPPVDVRELPDEYVVFADLPGLEPRAVDVTLDRDTLTIASARRDRLRAGGVPLHLERPAGKLHRSLRLPNDCDDVTLRTQIRDGVLEIHIAKAPHSQTAGRPS